MGGILIWRNQHTMMANIATIAVDGYAVSSSPIILTGNIGSVSADTLIALVLDGKFVFAPAPLNVLEIGDLTILPDWSAKR